MNRDDEQPKMQQLDQPSEGEQNEGEGSRTAARRYNEAVQQTVQRGNVEEEAEKAEREVEAKPEEYREAEEQGLSRSAGEAPGDLE